MRVDFTRIVSSCFLIETHRTDTSVNGPFDIGIDISGSLFFSFTFSLSPLSISFSIFPLISIFLYLCLRSFRFFIYRLLFLFHGRLPFVPFTFRVFCSLLLWYVRFIRHGLSIISRWTFFSKVRGRERYSLCSFRHGRDEQAHSFTATLLFQTIFR